MKKIKNKWTLFKCLDGTIEFQEVYIESPVDEALTILFERFREDFEDNFCRRCIERSFKISEGDDLAQLSAPFRGCDLVLFTPDGEEAPSVDYYILPRLKMRLKYVERPFSNPFFIDLVEWVPYTTLEEYLDDNENVLVLRKKANDM